MPAPVLGLKGVATSTDAKIGKTKAWSLKGVILSPAGATVPQATAIHGVPYSRKGIYTAGTGPSPSDENGVEFPEGAGLGSIVEEAAPKPKPKPVPAGEQKKTPLRKPERASKEDPDPFDTSD
jgi:hypothetical protein